MADAKNEEKIITIPLREAGKKAEKRKVNYTVSLVRKYLKTHMKAENVKLGKFLNDALWARGKKTMLRSVRVKLVKQGDTVKAELVGHDYQDFAPVTKEQHGKDGEKKEHTSPQAKKNEELEKKIESAGEEKTVSKEQMKVNVKAAKSMEVAKKQEV